MLTTKSTKDTKKIKFGMSLSAQCSFVIFVSLRGGESFLEISDRDA